MSFYQSQLRKYINKEIYKKNIFEIDFAKKKYRGVMKQQRRMGKEFRWYMMHGIELDTLSQFKSVIKDQFSHIERDFKKSWGDMFFQVGCINELDVSDTKDVKKQARKEELRKQREYIQSDLRQRYKIKPSWKEHMPNATQVLDLKETPTIKKLFESGRRYVKKGEKAELTFVRLRFKAEREEFREMRYAMSYDKGFGVMPKETFLELMKYLKKQKKGVLFAARKGENLVSGAVYFYYGKQLIYMYGATDRSFGAIGAQYWLTREIIKRGAKEGWNSLDLLGVTPPGYEDGHSLAGVTRFKQVFGGKTISYAGNYDLIFNGMLYKTFRALKK